MSVVRHLRIVGPIDAEPSHGTVAGYSAGCRDDCCARAKSWQRRQERIAKGLPVEPMREPPGPWAEHGACRGMDPDVFFPTTGRGHNLHDEHAAAKAICARCPVRDECREYGLNEPDGVWGGLDAAERRRLRRKRRQTRSVT